MKKTVQTRIVLISIVIWILVGIYGLVFNISYIDEIKYLIKGFLMINGDVGYYTTEGFFYQHMPGSFLLFGLGQKIFGPSLLVGRLQSFLIGLLVFLSSWWLSKKISGKLASLMTLVLLSLCPTVTFYYSTPTPQSLLILFLILGLGNLYDGMVKKSNFSFYLATIWFSLVFVIRENFLFSLGLYLGLLVLVFRKKLIVFSKHLLTSIISVSVFIVPGYPGTVNILKNFPGVSRLLPVSQIERGILSLYWKEDLQTIGLYWRAIRDFGVVFHAWIIIGGLLVVGFLIKKEKMKLSLKPKHLYWLFLVTIAGFNFFIHSWAAFKLSPRAIISYFPYIAPLVAVLMADRLAVFYKKCKKKQFLLLGYVGLLIMLPIGLRYGRNFAIPTLWPQLRKIHHSGKLLKPIVGDKDKIVWISEPHSLFLAGKVSYYPLINHINFYKPSDETEAVKNLGFWNIEMLDNWLKEAELVVIGDNKMKLLKESNQAATLTQFLEDKLANDYKLTLKTNQIWPGKLSFYEPINVN